jgi:apolipoprotein N-acyltransferase
MKNKMKNLLPNKQELYLGLLTTILFSSFLYLEYFGFTIKLLNTITAIGALYAFLHIPKKSILVAGFFIGILWFYWVGFSFEYYGFTYLIYIVSFIFGVVHMFLFSIVALTNNVFFRAILLSLVSYIEPMAWNWIQVELLFIESYIGVFKYQYIIVISSLVLMSYVKQKYKYAPLLLIIFALDYNPSIQKESDLKIKLVTTFIPQKLKWKKETLMPTVRMAFREIDSAIKEGYDIIVFPESYIPLYLNKTPELIDELLKKSKKIAIITGTLINENNTHYNVTYIFNNEKYTIAKKMILVPFGEYIPLPKFTQKIINDFFFNGAADFEPASKPTDYIIKGTKFRNAICWEASCPELYEGKVDYIIAISNNAWFTPSIEPTLQNLLIQYYGRKYGTTIYHSTNGSISRVLK